MSSAGRTSKAGSRRDAGRTERSAVVRSRLSGFLSATIARKWLDIHAYLSDPRRYEREIERLHQRHLFTRRMYELEQDGVSLATLSQNKSRVAKLISRTVACGEYRAEPACVKTIVVGGKERVIYALRLTDLIVQGVVAGLIERAMTPWLSDRLYSYRKGVSWWAAVSDCAHAVRAHRRDRPDPRTRGLYVLRRDIHSYTDSIPLGAHSPVWRTLKNVLISAAGDSAVQPADWALIERFVRQEAFVQRGRVYTLVCGAPTGQVISCVLFNLYLMEFDSVLAAIRDSYYARYSDDMIFAHPDAQVARETAVRIDQLLHERGLTVSADKSRDLYLTAAGRPSPEWPSATPATSIPFLGCRVWANGTVSLNRAKTRAFLRDVRTRTTRTARALTGKSKQAAGRAVCAVVNRMIDPGAEDLQNRSAILLRRAVTDRHQLKQLDHWIARIVLEAVSGRHDVRAFREIPYRTIRRQWSLRSLLHARNKWPGGAGR